VFTNPTAVHISLVTAIGAFATAGISIVCGFLLISSGTGNAETGLSINTASMQVNFYSFVPGVAFAMFGASLAAWSVHRLIKK